ncbi:hypothetical protein KSP40_PGU010812 [Platanthera guangdongensis]|uniref:Protein ApaG n=1 Tax=Platanthera guangdongensis TaxID=2320717 RepID=A0ABR2MA30_9ASPA
MMQSLGLKLASFTPAATAATPTASPRRREWARPCYRTVPAASGSSSSKPSFSCSSSSSASSSSSSEKGWMENDRMLSSPANSYLSRSHTYALLKKQLSVAAKSEDYKEAARIRDSLKSLEEQEPVLHLQALLKKAVEEERFQDAALYRNELNILAPHTLLKCTSDATTVGIRVQVRSVYIKSRSQPSKEQYFFAYRIRITNNSEHPVQLLGRHWIVTDGNEKTENIWGLGVIGEQPVILPNSGFEYSSACPLSTPGGRMEGDFEMKHIDMVGSSTFNVAIAPFSLSITGDEADHRLI